MNKIKGLHRAWPISVIGLLALGLSVEANLKLTNLKCAATDKLFGDFKVCALKAVNRNIVELSVHFGFAMDVVDNASVAMRFKKRGSGLLQNAIYQYKVDLCEFLRNKRRNPLADLFYALFQFAKYSNINHTCPYNHDIIVKGCRLNTQLLNVLAISPGEYTIFTTWFLQNKLAATVDVSVLVY